MLALYLAMRLGLPRPFWAPLTAYVVSSPMSGAVRSKAIYRFMGTLLGAFVSLLLVPRLINYAFLLTLALALWLGICLYVSLQDRTPRSYIFMLAGYTPALISFPALADVASFNALTMFDLVLARVQEISLGVGCAALVHSLFMPQSMGPVILKRMDQSLDGAMMWMHNALNGAPAATNDQNHRKLSQDITELRLMSTHLPFDTSNLRWTANAIRVLQDRLSSFVPFMTAVEDRIRVISDANGGVMPAAWRKLLADIADWTLRAAASTPEQTMTLRRQIAETAPRIDRHASWHQVLEVNLSAHLGRLLDTCEDCFQQRRQIGLQLESHAADATDSRQRIPTRALYTDKGLALMSAIAAIIAVSLSCAFWVLSGWPLGFAAPMMAALHCVFFATQDNPVPALKVTLIYTICSTPIAGLYLLLLLPSAHSFESLMLVMCPFFLIGGIYLARPNTLIRAIPLCFTTLATLTVFDTGATDMTTFINGQISQAIGVGLAVLFTSVLRSVSTEWTAYRLLRAGWHDISQLARSIRPPTLIAASVRMVDRVSLLAPRLAAAGNNSKLAVVDVLEDMRVEMNMTYLLRLRPRLERNNVSLDPLIQKISSHFENRPKQPALREADLLESIDRTLNSVCHTNDFPMRNEAIAALAGLRRDLFPQATPFQTYLTQAA